MPPSALQTVVKDCAREPTISTAAANTGANMARRFSRRNIASSVFPRFRRRKALGLNFFQPRTGVFLANSVDFLGEGPLAETHHKFRAHHTKHGSRLKRRQYVFHFRLLRRSRFGASPAAPSARRCRALKLAHFLCATTTCDCSSSSLPNLFITQQKPSNQPSFFK